MKKVDRYLYWDKVQLTRNFQDGKTHISFLDDICVYDINHLSSFYEVSDPAEFLSNTPVQNFLKILFIPNNLLLLPLLLTEIFFKFTAASIVTGYVFFRETFKNSETKGEKFLFLIPLVPLLLFNALLAQPIFFFGRVIAHVRTFVDGFINTLSIFIGAKPKRVTAGVKAMGKSILFLAVDVAVAVVCFGAAKLCAVIPGCQLLVPYLFTLPTTLQLGAGGVTAMVAHLGVATTQLSTSSIVSSLGEGNIFTKLKKGFKHLNNFFRTAEKEKKSDIIDSPSKPKYANSPPKTESPNFNVTEKWKVEFWDKELTPEVLVHNNYSQSESSSTGCCNFGSQV